MMETLVAWFAVPPRAMKAHQMALPVSEKRLFGLALPCPA
jgi:hypothetical protein